MNKSILATAALAASAATALAADLPSLKAPPPVYVPPPVIWTGFYVGLNAGGVWSKSDITWTTNTFGLVPGHREAIDAAGTGNIDSNGFTGGGQVGFNYQMHHLVLGLEADFNYTGLSGTRTATAVPPIGPAEPIAETFNSNFMATFRGRIGITAGPWLAYATVGTASAHVNYGDNIIFPLLGSSNGASANIIATGWVAGGGVEWMLTPSWSVKAEYLHIDLGHKFNRSLNTAPPFIIPIIGHDHALVEDAARVGINYRFGPSNVVAAKY